MWKVLSLVVCAIVLVACIAIFVVGKFVWERLRDGVGAGTRGRDKTTPVYYAVNERHFEAVESPVRVEGISNSRTSHRARVGRPSLCKPPLLHSKTNNTTTSTCANVQHLVRQHAPVQSYQRSISRPSKRARIFREFLLREKPLRLVAVVENTPLGYLRVGGRC